MKKMLMISIKPQFACNILNGIKTGELRKNKALRNAVEKEIQEKGYCEIAMYVSKNKPYLYKFNFDDEYVVVNDKYLINNDHILNGKVVAKFRARKVEDITGNELWIHRDLLEEITCVDRILILRYAIPNLVWDRAFYQFCKDYKDFNLCYVLHIEDLYIYRKPKELNEFNRPCQHWDNEHQCYSENLVCSAESCKFYKNTRLTKAPQNFCYVKEM